MYKVSEAYKKSMKSGLRNRSFIMISFGLINQEAQASATVEGDDFAYFATKEDLFGQRTDEYIYGTLEQDFTKVDGSMYFLPRESESAAFYDVGLVSRDVVTDTGYELLIEFNILPTDLKGLTINFGEIYAVDFDILAGEDQVVEIRDNDKRIFTTEEVFNKTTYIKIIFYKMKNPYSRLRIYSMLLGIGLAYYNSDVMSSQLDSYISPICADVPQIDFMVKLKNYDQYFNVDNPDSAINFLETGQEMYVYYGYQTDKDNPKSVEWLKGAKLLCSDWESDDASATIRCKDIFRSMDEEYHKGQYYSIPISYYDLATAVFEDAGFEEYYIDPYLKKLSTSNPLPRVRHKEALQIIANACRSVLSQDRNGKPRIKASFEPEYTITSNGEAAYSNLKNIKKNDAKDEYATLSVNYTTANGEMFFLPRNQSEADRHTGYVSAQQSGEDCTFSVNPMLTITKEAASMYYGLKMIFGQALPAEIIFRTYNDGEAVDTYTISEDITKTLSVIHDFDDFDVMEIEFTKTAEPYNNIVLNYFTFGDITDFKVERNDMMSSPKAIKQELVKQVQVVCYSYQNGVEEESLASEEVEATIGDTITYYFSEASYNRRVVFGTNGARIADSGAYFVTVEFLKAGKNQLEIYGYKYSIVEKYATKELNPRGKTIKWENPIISNMDAAEKLASWIADYYNAGIEYEYNYRGNPEIDANDAIFQENAYYPDMLVNAYRHTVKFGGALSGKINARRINHLKTEDE